MYALSRQNTQQFEKRPRVSIQSCLLRQPAVCLERDVAEKKLPLEEWVYADAEPSTRPNKIFSSLDGTTIRIRSPSSFLSPFSVSGLLRILQWAVLPFDSWYKFDQICATLRVSNS